MRGIKWQCSVNCRLLVVKGTVTLLLWGKIFIVTLKCGLH